jgi:hypothetical protein
MISWGVRTAIFALALIWGGLIWSDSQAQEVCSNWKVRKLDKAPEWYEAALSRPPTYIKEKINDSLSRLEYSLSDGLKLVQYWSDAYTPQWDTGSPYVAPGSLYLCGADTVLLDSNLCGYSTLRFNHDSTWCVAGELWAVTEDGMKGSIVWYDLRTRQKTVLHSWISPTGPDLAPIWDDVAYADKGDLYIFSLAMMDAELVFKRGGSYVDARCPWHFINSILWSTNGDRSLVFKYYEDIGSRSYELYEVLWSPFDERPDSTGR